MKKQFFRAVELFNIVPGKFYNRRFYFGRRDKNAFVHLEEILNVIICLQQYAQDPVPLTARWR